MSQVTPLENVNGQPNQAMLLAVVMKSVFGSGAVLEGMTTEDKENIRDILNASLGSSASGKKQKLNTGLYSSQFYRSQSQPGLTAEMFAHHN